MNQFIARQPIFDRNKKVYAYELLYRSDDGRNSAGPLKDPDRASSETILTGFHNIGIEKITGGRRAFVNFTERLLETGVATLFPKETLVVEVLENVRPTEEVIGACRQLKQMGYMLALDDFVLSDQTRPLLKMADIIKVDWLNTPEDELPALASLLKATTPFLLAEKIETEAAFEKAFSMGFSLFQGYFFSKPIVLSRKKAEPLMAHYMQLIRLAHREDTDFRDLAQIIRRDAILSYRLLRLVNSAFFGMQYQVTDIQSALAVLGMNEVKKWVSLLVMIGVNADKPEELVLVSLIRGRTLELIAQRFFPEENVGNFFLIGLFSLLDVILDSTMEEALAELSIPEGVSKALTNDGGRASELLRLLADYERGRWDAVEARCDRLQLSPKDLSGLFFESILWCRDFSV